jgi:hypothetical protein
MPRPWVLYVALLFLRGSDMILPRLSILRHEFTISEFGAFDWGMYVICYFCLWPVHHKWILDCCHQKCSRGYLPNSPNTAKVLVFYWPSIFLSETFCVLVLLVATLSPLYNLSTPRKHGSVLGVPMSRATGTLLPDLFLALHFVLVPCYSFPASCKPDKRIQG